MPRVGSGGKRTPWAHTSDAALLSSGARGNLRSHMVNDSAQRVTQRPIRSIVGASSGNLVEWFDFYVYAFTALHFSSAFFPGGSTTAQLMKTSGVYALGFFARPLGSWIFGRLADRTGRRRSMVIAVLMMSFGSLMVACLPTYATIGVAAPVLLTIARVVQGISVGGEYGTSAAYMSEVARPGRRGFYASFQYVTLIAGQLLATVVLVILQAFLSQEELKAWGWRVPFVIGAIAALVALYVRRSLDETTTAETRAHEQAGTLRGMLAHPRAVLLVMGYTAAGSLLFYTYTTYMQKYLVTTTHFPAAVATNIMTAALFCFMLIQPAFGALSDRIGRRTSMLCFGAFGILTTLPLLGAIGASATPIEAFGFVILALAGVSFYSSISGIVKAEMFPVQIRGLAVGLPYAISNAIFGGTAEYVALWFKNRGTEELFFWYVTAVAAIGLVSALLMPDNRVHGYLRDDQLSSVDREVALPAAHASVRAGVDTRRV
ncbi:MAG TPA: MFS family transporter [Gemmatimonadaceae bacterium]|nr:MFS family transporter [Gemmatimonadaceae bacterium]